MPTINRYIYTLNGITLGNNGYGSPLAITSYGGVFSESQDSPAVFIYAQSTQTLINDGKVVGAEGGAGVEMLTTGVLSNSGLISGGFGGSGVNNTEAAGGRGVIVATDGTITNFGSILGGNCFKEEQPPGDGETGGIGIDIYAAGTLTNNGVIAGGFGGEGYVTGPTGGYVYGGAGGAGVSAANDPGNVMVNSGSIEGGAGGNVNYRFAAYGGNGGAGVALGGGFITNYGLIIGGNGGSASGYKGSAGAGGDGLDLGGGGLTNMGQINGGNGGNIPGAGTNDYFAANGGTGLSATNSSIFSSGDITGGNGGAITTQGGFGGAGGTGVALSGGNMINAGEIRGGYGGYVTQNASYTAYGGIGGTGVVITGGAVFTNAAGAGTIVGGTGGENIYTGRQGGYGVYIDGGTLINAGVIYGGAGGQSQGPPGPTGDAVLLGGSAPSVLVVRPTASFYGTVLAMTSSDVLEFAGKSRTPLNISQFSGFDNIDFAAGAKWKIEGSQFEFDQRQTISGFTADDKIDMVDSVGGKGKVTVKKANEVTIKVGEITYKLDIAGAQQGETDFKFSNHVLSKTAPAMAFIAPPAPAATTETIPTLAQAGKSALPAGNGWTVMARPTGAPIHQLTPTSHGILQTGITLHPGGSFF